MFDDAFKSYIVRQEQIEQYISSLRAADDWTDPTTQAILASRNGITSLTSDENDYIISHLI